jgi:hypothetical protein
MMFIFGVIPFVPLVLITIQQGSDALQYGGLSNWEQLVFAVMFTAITGAITINFLLSILEITKVLPPSRTSKPKPNKERNKKMPKRRKDFH